MHGTLFEPVAAVGSPAGVAVELLGGLAQTWLLPAGLVTLLLGACGALAARDLRVLVAWLVVGSAGTLLAALGLGTTQATAAALYYLPHSTFAAGAAFLAVESIARARAGRGLPTAEHYLVNGGVPLGGAPWVGAGFFAAALVIAGLPPGSGFIAKALLLNAAVGTSAQVWLWSSVLFASLLVVASLARAASAVFWRPGAAPAQRRGVGATAERPADRDGVAAAGDHHGLRLASGLLLGSGLAMVLLARSLFEFMLQAAGALGGS